jgi:hypothetical protein
LTQRHPRWGKSTRPVRASGKVPAHLAPGEPTAAAPAAPHSRSRRAPTGGSRLRFLIRHCRPVRTSCEVSRQLASREFRAATPTAFHPRPSWPSDVIERRPENRRPNTHRLQRRHWPEKHRSQNGCIVPSSP